MIFARMGMELANRTAPWASGLMGRVGNFVRAHVLSAALTSGAAAMSGCGADERIKMDTPGGIPPLTEPLPNETDPVNPTPRDNFANCLPPNRSLELRVKGYMADGNVATGIMSIDRQSLTFPAKTAFMGVARWVSFPTELDTQDPFSDGYGLMARRAEARTSGEGLDRLTRDGGLGFWSDQFSSFPEATQMGFYWLVNGTFNPDSCDIQLTFQSTEVSPDGLRGEPLPYLNTALYTPRSDGAEGLAEAGFQNERVAILNGSPTVSFKGPTADQVGQYTQKVVMSSSEADFVSGNEQGGAFKPQMLEMEILSLPRDGEVSSPTEMPTTPDGGTDGGIPGLPGPQPEEMTPAS